MRIQALMDTTDVSGPGKQLAALIPELRKLDIELRPLLFGPEDSAGHPFKDYLSERGIEADLIRSSARLDKDLIAQTQTVIDDWGADIVQSHSYRPSTIVALLRRHSLERPWIAFFHGATAPTFRVRAYNLLDNIVVRTADQIVVVARRQKSRYVLHRNKVTVLHNAILGTDVPTSVMESENARLPQVGRPRLAVIGRLSSEKGVDIFLRAAARIDAPFVAAIVGDGPSRAALVALCEQLDLNDRVSFVGRIDPVDAVYDWCDAVVIPSRSEGMPNVLLESIRHGKPVVATDVGNIREVLTNSPTLGSVVSPHSASELAFGIRRLLTTKAQPSSEERSRLLATYSVEARAEAHRSLYERVLNRSSS